MGSSDCRARSVRALPGVRAVLVMGKVWGRLPSYALCGQSQSAGNGDEMTASTVQRPPRNGVDVPTLFATLDAVKGAPQLAQFQFRATNEWVSGTHNRSTIQSFYGAAQEDVSRATPFTYDADHPAV